MEHPAEHPEPFLRPPLAEGVPHILAGWLYDEAERHVHGVANHGAVDFECPIGTPVLAAADGWAIATFDEFPLVEEDGKPRLLEGEPIWFGAGLIVQIWHGDGRYTQYAHLDSIPEHIPFYTPEETDGALRPRELTAPAESYGGTVPAYAVRAGEKIGESGMTGMGIGRRSYEDWRAGRPYATYASPHVHFAVFGGRDPESRAAPRWDPFGIYDTAPQYPEDATLWPELPDSLWLPR